MKQATKTNRIDKRKTEFRDKITEAALKLFEQNGVADTSIASIIREADIAHKTFFNHFPSKDHLLQHIVSSHSHHANVFFRDALNRSDDPKKRLEYCFTSIAKALEPLNPQRYSDLLTFYFVSNASTKAFRDEQKQNWTELIYEILNDAQTKNRLKKNIDIETQSEMIIGIFVATLLSWSMEENYPIVSKMKKAAKFINESVFTDN